MKIPADSIITKMEGYNFVDKERNKTNRARK